MKRSKNTLKRYENSIEEKKKLLKNLEVIKDLKIHPIKHHASPIINCNNLSIYYANKTVFNDVNFSINNEERVAICGKNGCGKSTLLKFILGEEIKYTGVFNKASNLLISYVSQDTSYLKGSLKEYSIKNNIDESLFKAILSKLDFSRLQFEKDMSDYSAGQKKKVLIASSLCQKAHLYVWDEPLNFIDIYSRMQIQQLLTTYNATMIFVEHDAKFVEEVATKTIFI